MPAVTDETGLERRLDQLDRFLYRHRHVAGPPAVAALAAAVGTGGHYLNLLWLVAAIAGVTLLCGLDAVRDLTGTRETVWAVTGWLAGCGWTTLLAWQGPRPLWLWIVFAVGLTVWGIPWAKHHRVRRGVTVDRAIEAWGDGHAVGLKGTKVRGTRAGDGWFSFKIASDEPGMHTLDTYRAAARRIAARFGVRAEAISFAATKHEGEVECTVRDKPRETRAVEVDTGVLSVIGEHTIGHTDNGDPITYALYLAERGAQHGAAVGATGSGKSSWINRLAEIAVRSEDALLWMVDLSYGAMELRAWAPACDWFAHTVDEAERMLDALPGICDSRGKGKPSGRLHIPSVKAPAVVLVIDEGATLYAPDLLPADAEMEARTLARRVAEARRQKAGQLARLARKYGITLAVATQYGDNDALGGGVAKQQLASGYALVFYSARNTDGHLLIPAGHGIRCSEFPQDKPGTCGIKGPTIDGDVRGRIDYMTNDAIAATVAEWRDKQPTLEPHAIAAAGPAYVHRNRTAPGTDGWDTAGEGGESARQAPNFAAAFTTVEGTVPGRLTPEQSRRLVWDTLAGFPDGAGPTEIAAGCGRSVPIVTARLRELAADGLVKREHRGRWTVTDSGYDTPYERSDANAHKPPAERS